MKEIGEFLKSSREEKGISIEEASEDLKLSKEVVEQIELGNKDVFKDIYELRSCVNAYGKYLCLDCGQILDDFNEFVFEYTSKIPIEEIAKASMEMQPETKKISSPYTQEDIINKKSYNKFIIIGAVLAVIIILALIIILWGYYENEFTK